MPGYLLPLFSLALVYLQGWVRPVEPNEDGLGILEAITDKVFVKGCVPGCSRNGNG